MKSAKQNSKDKPKKEQKNPLDKFLNSEDSAVSFIRDILLVLGAVGIIALLLILVSGTWPAVVAVESESMVPNMNIGDLVFVVSADRYGDLQTWEDGLSSGYAKFNNYPDKQGNSVFGDVIIYRPNGDDSVHPIIHRAYGWYESNESNPLTNSGYITKGDNNNVYDQLSGISGIGVIKPVKSEWIIGKALFSVPYLGYAPLHLFEFAVILIAIMIIHELYLRRRGDN
ncbi:S26 family signal peptidase [Methanomicrobium antiquum]|uniref:S26 family signal peptidase n=1 Tax=Methanomicrobium antiquum TaxID=487686 RepID=A0AAF0FMQ5_9EURY|nr:S26 family signal peptidase [Methanomicrobium antiquum]WFN36322.1 S26 family signal peptidase [Methanomicrobium antiquum]